MYTVIISTIASLDQHQRSRELDLFKSAWCAQVEVQGNLSNKRNAGWEPPWEGVVPTRLAGSASRATYSG